MAIAHTYTAVDTTNMDWGVAGILDPGDTHGFAYTKGLHRRGRAELLMRDVPAMHILSGLVARVLNSVAARDADVDILKAVHSKNRHA